LYTSVEESKFGEPSAVTSKVTVWLGAVVVAD
jgi:hypothetical protein